LCHAAKEESDELTVLSQELDSKLLELKNFSDASTVIACTLRSEKQHPLTVSFISP